MAIISGDNKRFRYSPEHPFTAQDLKDIMEMLMQREPKKYSILESIKTLQWYFGMSEEQLEKELPEGTYTIGDALITGKRGLIQFILLLQAKPSPWEQEHSQT